MNKIVVNLSFSFKGENSEKIRDKINAKWMYFFVRMQCKPIVNIIPKSVNF